MKPLKCPRCGNDKYFYRKESFKGTFEWQVNNEGEVDDTCNNSHIHEGATYKLRSVYYFCCDCDKKVSKIPLDKRW